MGSTFYQEMERPAGVYRVSPRRPPKRFNSYDYPLTSLVRRVSRYGTIRVFGNQAFVSQDAQRRACGAGGSGRRGLRPVLPLLSDWPLRVEELPDP